MRLRELRRPSPALVISCLALFVALGGTSYAVVKLPPRSVGTKQLKPNAVTSAKVKDNALTGADVNEAMLGQVPSAATAGSAASAGTAAAVAPNSVGSAQVVDRALTASDVTSASGSVTINPPSLGQDTCSEVFVYTGVNVHNDPVLILPDDSFPEFLNVQARDDSVDPETVTFHVCNYTASTIDPPETEFFWVVFNMP